MLNGQDVDLLFTGELSHHEALGAIEQGKVVVTAFHSNSERRFLSQVMKRDLQAHIAEALKAQAASTRLDGAKPVAGEVSSDIADFEVAVSEVDRDPYEIIVAGSSSW
jgi:putative NIF3 family GTP cyclohydrolase 1 type 2